MFKKSTVRIEVGFLFEKSLCEKFQIENSPVQAAFTDLSRAGRGRHPFYLLNTPSISASSEFQTHLLRDLVDISTWISCRHLKHTMSPNG